MNIKLLRRQHIEALNSELLRLVEELKLMGARLIVLFGSMAHGNPDLFSDIDLLVVMESSKPFLQRNAEIYDKLKPLSADILTYTPEEFESLRKHSSMIRLALEEGKCLYESGN